MFGLGAGELLILTALGSLLYVPLAFYLLTLQRTLAACAEENRAMQPGLVWLQLIPLFGLVWQFFVVGAISRSLAAEFESRGMPPGADPVRTLGIATCVLTICSHVIFFIIPIHLTSLVCWILFWVRVAGQKARLVPLA
jgi:hypothetical protein